MKKIISLFLLATCFMSAGCQSKSYKIEGSCSGSIADGDTLFITNGINTEKPIDTVVVKDGKFELSGNTDSTFMCMIYSTKDIAINQSFFIEPGTIKLNVSENPTQQKVSGTDTNDKWQVMNDSVLFIAVKINQIASNLYQSKTTLSEQKEMLATVEELHKQYSAIIIDFAKKNISNELGYFILTFYPEEFIDSRTRLELIEKMPKKMRDRTVIRNIQQSIKQSMKYDIGGKLDDFSMNTINGNKESIIALVKKHKITIIDFWASWCGPCRAEMPSMVDLYKKLNGKGLGIIGISLDEKQEAWKQAVKQLNITWPQLSDLKGWQSSAARMFNINAIPYTIIVDKDGTILNKNLRGKELADFVESKLQ